MYKVILSLWTSNWYDLIPTHIIFSTFIINPLKLHAERNIKFPIKICTLGLSCAHLKRLYHWHLRYIRQYKPCFNVTLTQRIYIALGELKKSFHKPFTYMYKHIRNFRKRIEIPSKWDSGACKTMFIVVVFLGFVVGFTCHCF